MGNLKQKYTDMEWNELEEKQQEAQDPQKFSANDVDGAYFIGVINSAGLDGLISEAQRFKELGYLPHQIIKLLKDSEIVKP